MVEYGGAAGDEFDLTKVTSPEEAPTVRQAKERGWAGPAPIELSSCIEVRPLPRRTPSLPLARWSARLPSRGRARAARLAHAARQGV